ncbi:MAG TPA: transcription antitermination factor NusB [Phycisphaerales bacterium]|nr:transcription antitermination factor NusB [Phycisphaerales bacterium]
MKKPGENRGRNQSSGRRGDRPSYKSAETKGSAEGRAKPSTPSTRSTPRPPKGKPQGPPPRGRRPEPARSQPGEPPRLTLADLHAAEPEAWSVPTGDRARDAVMSHLARQVRRFPRLELTGPELPVSADPRDAALAHAINDAVVRRWTTLDRLIAKKARKPLASIDPPVRAALLAGAAQIVLLDRVPPHAAVNHAVQWTKLNVNTGSSGFVNAVLHRIAEALGADSTAVPLPADWPSSRRTIPLPGGMARILTEDLMPEEDERRAAVALGLAPALLAMLRATLGEQAAFSIALASLSNAPTVLNAAHAKLAGEIPDTAPHHEPGHLLYTGPHAELTRLLKARPDIWAQDAASSHTLRHAAKVLADAGVTPLRILDLCAGQGTKTRQLAALFKDAKIVATDTDERRLSVLSALFHGSPQVSVVRAQQVEALAKDTAFDLILLDVPCSNTGVLARRPEARHRYTPDAVKDLVALQRQIVAHATNLLALTRTAAIIYATCSLDPRENQQQIEWARFDCGLEPLGAGVTTLPVASPPAEPTHVRDGAFVQLMVHAPTSARLTAAAPSPVSPTG